jgi:hypothetical protein
MIECIRKSTGLEGPPCEERTLLAATECILQERVHRGPFCDGNVYADQTDRLPRPADTKPISIEMPRTH